MSKRVDATLERGRCRHTFVVSLYRTLWIEYLENRDLTFSDKLNVFDCPQCGFVNRVDFPIMATNTPRHFAVWYEPYPDPQIDVDSEGYTKLLGAGNYLAVAPRVTSWSQFKQTIMEFESGERKGEMASPVNAHSAENAVLNLEKPSRVVSLLKNFVRKN